MDNKQILDEIEKLRHENAALRTKLSGFEKGTKREAYDIDALGRFTELRGSLYEMLSYGPRGNDELLTKLGTIVRHVLFVDEKVDKLFKYRDGREVWREQVPRLSDINDVQYGYYLTALDRIYQALAETFIEYQHSRHKTGEQEANK